jgi:hypothetical protein
VGTRSQWFNPCAFETPTVGTLGNAPRNSLHGPTYWNADTSVHRVFPIREGVSVKFDAEAFNVFNHPIFDSPAATVNHPTNLGQINSVANSSRILQFAAKVQF